MLLNSVEYLIFIALSVTVYYLLPTRFRNAFLLLSSYVFYIWAIPKYAVLLLFVTTGSYFAARFIEKEEHQKAKKAYMAVTVTLLVLLLAVFKYFNFFMAEITSLLGLFGVTLAPIELKWALPLGISFYTFQVVGYLVDVYHGKTKSEKSFIDYALFVSFFPQILSGPIGRANELLPQYKEEHKFDYGNIVAGLQRFLMGAFKKVVLADGMALLVNEVYGNLYEHQGLSLITAVILYSFQLYFDFAGYTDMAVGSARLLGFRLRENFRQPYFATDMGDFWSRWHMSLTTWFNDYIFTPLVWSRWANKLVFGKKWEEHKPHFAANLIIVFLISGLWHGAGMTYVLWGLFHGAVRAVEELISRGIPKAKRKKKKTGVLLWLCRLKAFVIWTFSLIIFRAATISDVGYILANMFREISLTNYVEFLGDAVAQNISSATLYYALFAFIIIASLIIASALDAKSYRAYAENSGFDNNPLALYKAKPRWALYWVMGISTMFFYFITLTSANGNAGFIYLGF